MELEEVVRDLHCRGEDACEVDDDLMELCRGALAEGEVRLWEFKEYVHAFAALD